MKYELILEKGNYALIKRGEKLNEYAVVSYLDPKTGIWEHTVCSCGFGGLWNTDEAVALHKVLNVFLAKTMENYVTWDRLLEIATLEKDKLLEIDSEEAMEFFESELQADDYERELLGVDEMEELL